MNFKKALAKRLENPAKETRESSLLFAEKLIKGKIAETLIHQLFENSNYYVYRFGMEYTIPGIVDLRGKEKCKELAIISRTPDFVVRHKETNKVNFVEVKYCSSESFDILNFKEKHPPLETLVVVVSAKHIKCISLAELLKGQRITPTCKSYLGDRSEFVLSNELIKEYCQLAYKFYGNL